MSKQTQNHRRASADTRITAMPFACLLVLAICFSLACRSHPGDKADIRVTVEWPKGKSTVEIPLEYLEKLPVIKCRLNGKPAVLYVDTAAQVNSLYQDRLARFGLRVTGPSEVTSFSAGGERKLALSSAHELELSGQSRDPQGAVQSTVSLKIKVSEALVHPVRNPAHNVDGILGVAVLKALNAVIDLEQNKLVLKASAATEPAGSSSTPPSR